MKCSEKMAKVLYWQQEDKDVYKNIHKILSFSNTLSVEMTVVELLKTLRLIGKVISYKLPTTIAFSTLERTSWKRKIFAVVTYDICVKTLTVISTYK